MRRLRNIESGVVVSCDDETAARLGSEWVPVEADEPKPARRRAKKSDES